MYGEELTFLPATGLAGSGSFAEFLASNGNGLWMVFAIVALSFGAVSAKQLLARPKPHRP